MSSNSLLFMYHSVSSETFPEVLGSFPISMNRFMYQINAAKKQGYQFDYISNLHKNISSNKKIIYITGDDGTIDWTRNVLPWCEKNKIPTHTGVITGPWENNPIYPLTHIIQVILMIREEYKLIELSNKIQKYHLSEEEISYINRIYHYETKEYRRFIKGAFNLILDEKISYQLLGNLEKKELNVLKDRFESPDFYKRFKYSQIGVHTRSHIGLTKKTNDYVNHEIKSSQKTILEYGLEFSKYFVSPMKPKFGATLYDLKDDLQKLGFNGILDSNEGIWNRKDYIIPRIDAKNIEKTLKIEPFNF